MDRQQMELVGTSFAFVQPIAPQAAAHFQGHLFSADPTLRQLFLGDMTQQGELLMKMIGGYGVVDTHDATVGGTLLPTLEQGLGDAFTPATRAAWAEMYGVINRTMTEAAHATKRPGLKPLTCCAARACFICCVTARAVPASVSLCSYSHGGNRSASNFEHQDHATTAPSFRPLCLSLMPFE